MSDPFDSGTSGISLALDVPFPANVISGPGVKVDKTSGTWTVSLDFPPLVDAGIPANPNAIYLAGYDTGLGLYEKLRLDNLISGATGLDQRTPRGDADYTIQIGDRYIGLTAALTAVRTWTLPPAVNVPPGRLLVIQDEVGGISGTNYLRFIPTGANTINGINGPFLLKPTYGGVAFHSDGTSRWDIANPAMRRAVGDTNFTILPGDTYVATSVAFTAARIWTLPAANAVSAGYEVMIVDEASALTPVRTLTVLCAGADTVNGAASISLGYGVLEGVRLRSDGVSKWIFPNLYGALDGFPIGSVTPSTGSFTNLSSTDGTLVTSSLVTSSLNGGPLAGNRNRIINGDMRIDQRFGGATVNALAATVVYLVDRWFYTGTVAGRYNAGRQPGGPAGFSNSLGFVVAAISTPGPTDANLLSQAIEGLNISDLGWGTSGASPVTLSFWFLTTVIGTHSGALFGAQSYPFSFSIPVSNTWTKIAITIPGPTTGAWAADNSAGLFIRFNLGCGSNYLGTAGAWVAGNLVGVTSSVSLVGTLGASAFITGVQLEPGSVATPFERRIYSLEFEMCRRYYQRYVGTGATNIQYISYQSAGGFFETSFAIPPMRAAPAAALIGTWTQTNCTGLTVAAGGTPSSVSIFAQATALGSLTIASPANGGYDLTSEL